MTKSGLFMKYFVLSPHKNTPYGKASRNAVLEYAMSIQDHDPQFAHDLNKWLYEIHMELERKNKPSEPAQGVKILPDMPAAVKEAKVPESDEPGLQDLTFETNGSYENAPEQCETCKSKNINFLDHENGMYPQWECYDCGEIFYDSNYKQSTGQSK